MKPKYSNNCLKLMHHPERIREIKDRIFRPITLQFSLTDRCNLNCDFCANQNRTQQEFASGEVYDLLKVFSQMGAISVEFTGGEPTLHPAIEWIIESAANMGYAIGIKTNGINLRERLSTHTLFSLSWLRVSMNTLDTGRELDLTGVSAMTTLGFSYVIDENTKEKSLLKLHEYVKRYDPEYVRVIPDHRLKPEIREYACAKVMQSPVMHTKELFLDNRDLSIPEHCMIPYLHPYISPDHFVYACCATQMWSEERRKQARICSTNADDIRETWARPKPFDSDKCRGMFCPFKAHNELLNYLSNDTVHNLFV